MPLPLSWTTAGITTTNTNIIDWSNWFWFWVSSTSTSTLANAPTATLGEFTYAAPTPVEAPPRDDARQFGLARYRAACARARETLLLLLDPDNQERVRLGQALRVRGSVGNEYEIHHGYTSNVKRVRDGAYFCAHPPLCERDSDSMLPVEDVWIAQMLALQTDEAAFLAVAHRAWDGR